MLGIKVFRMIGPETKLQILGLMVLNFFSALTESIGVGAIFVVLKVSVDPGSISSLPSVNLVAGILGGQRAATIVLIGFVVAIFFGRLVAQVLSAWWTQTVRYRAQYQLSKRLMESYLAQPYAALALNSTASGFTQIWTNVTLFVQTYLLGLVDLAATVCTSFAFFLILLYLQPEITIGSVVVIGTFGLAYWFALWGPIQRWGATFTKNSEVLLHAAMEAINGIKVIKVTGTESYFLQVFSVAARAYLAASRRFNVAQQLPRPALESLLVLGLLGWGVAIVNSSQSPAQLLPTVTVFGMAAYRILPSMIRALSALQSMAFSRTTVDNVYENFLNSTAQCTRKAPPDIQRTVLTDRIVVDGVSLSYPGGQGPALHGVDLTIEKGQAVAFIGASGAGKSTLADVIIGLLAPSSGRVLVDGAKQTLESARLSGLYGYVPQETFVLNDTIRRNIAFGRSDDEIDDRRVRRAIEASMLVPLVDSLPEGANTVLGDRGGRISGGERQRLGLARALYLDPSVLVLDEPTASLDAETESEVLDEINALRGEKTLIIIAHRLSTVQNCDKLFFFDAGRLIASGTFNELMEQNARFQDIVASLRLFGASEGR